MGFVVYSSWTSRAVRIHREGCAALKKSGRPSGDDEGVHRAPKQQRFVKWSEAEEAAKSECKRVGAGKITQCGLCMPSP